MAGTITTPQPSAKVSKETYLSWYESMLLQRKFEEKEGQMYGQQKIRGFCHLYIGMEAVSAGIVSAIRPEDVVITAYRDHGIALAKGLSAKSCMAELFGKVTGCSRGKGGSMHFFSEEHRFYGGHGIVGAQISLGAGIAFAEKYKGTDNICVCMFGDGAVHQGVLHETFNMAKLWDLPVIFVCENNGYAMGTSVKRSSSLLDIYKKGEAYDIPCEPVDGMSVEAVHEAVSKAAKHLREGKGPYFLEVRTYRYKGHSVSDPAKYRTKEEVESYKQKDPIEMVRKTILKEEMADERWFDEQKDKIRAEIEEAIVFAEQSPYPDESELYTDIYAEKDYPFLKD